MSRYLAAWLLATALGCLSLHRCARIDPTPPPDSASRRWAMSTLERARRGNPPMPPPPAAAAYRRGPILTLAWWRGRVQARHVGEGSLAESIRAAAAAFAVDQGLTGLPGWPRDASEPVRFSVTVVEGEAPLVRGIPFLSELSVVPLVDGVLAEHAGKRAYVTPDELTAAGLWDAAVVTPIPDLSFGLDLAKVTQMLALRVGVDPERLVAEGRLRRFRAQTLLAEPYPGDDPARGLSPAVLDAAAREGAEFLIRHQAPSGRFTYVYEGQHDRAGRRGYSLPRHSGATYFLAQVARRLGLPEARRAVRRALRFVEQKHLTVCGGADRFCIDRGGSADIGSAALTSLAAAELLRGGDDPRARRLLTGLNAFMRSMQRPDGELMHVYDLEHDKPVDVQKMYYSGEAAYALLHSHRVLGDARDLRAARKLMTHLTGSAWSFFGSRYFYGEEHWTCQAAAQAADRMPVDEAVDFCSRWLAFQRRLLYRHGQTPWPVAGAIGVGPFLLPRLTAVASRVEAGSMIYRLLEQRGDDVGALRRQMEASLGLLMRMRWAPGPAHLLANPAAALGGLPATQASLEVRNDFVQHAGSAMLLWAEVLEHEAVREGAAASTAGLRRHR